MFEKDLNMGNLYLEIVSCDFLYYSWLWLKKEKFFLKTFFRYSEEPISNFWFMNASSLLRSGMYNYIKNKNSFLNKRSFNINSLIRMKNEIIETAFFLRLFPLFERYYFLKTLNLKKQLRLLIANS